MIETAGERVLLLKSGFTGKQIEALYRVLNGFEAVGVDWDEAAVKPAICFLDNQRFSLVAGTQAAPPQEVRA